MTDPIRRRATIVLRDHYGDYLRYATEAHALATDPDAAPWARYEWTAQARDARRAAADAAFILTGRYATHYRWSPAS